MAQKESATCAHWDVGTQSLKWRFWAPKVEIPFVNLADESPAASEESCAKTGLAGEADWIATPSPLIAPSSLISVQFDPVENNEREIRMKCS